MIVPQIVDQPYRTARVADPAIGAAQDGPTPTVGSMSIPLETALPTATLARAIAVAGGGQSVA